MTKISIRNLKQIDGSGIIFRMYGNPGTSYSSIFVALCQMSVALLGSSRDVPVYTSNKFATIDWVKGSTASYTEVAEVQGITMTYSILSNQKVALI